MLTKLLSLVIVIVMTFTAVPISNETEDKVTDTAEQVAEIISENDTDTSENETSVFVDKSEDEDFEVSEQAMDDERDPMSENIVDIVTRGYYRYRHALLGTSKARLYTRYEIVGLHSITQSLFDVDLEDEEGSEKRYDFPIRNIGCVGRFYYDLNAENQIGAKYGVNGVPSIMIAATNREESESKIIRLTQDNSDYAFNPESIDIPVLDQLDCFESDFTCNGIKGDVHRVSYTLNENTTVSDDYTLRVSTTTVFDIDYKYVDSTQLWNLYSIEADITSGVSRRDPYKEVYIGSDAAAWNNYESALVSARLVLCGGVEQEEIDNAYDTLCSAVLALKTIINYNTNGATSGSVTTPQYYTIHSNVSTSSTSVTAPTYTYATVTLADYSGLTKTGYICKGWSTSSTATTGIDSLTMTHAYGTNGVMLYAAWTPITYTVKYNANPPSGKLSTGAIANQMCTYNTSYTASANFFIVSGYKFKHWNTNAEGTGTSYAAGTTIKNLTTEDGSTVNLYAIWEPDTSNITFNINLPSGVTSTTSGFSANTTKALTIGSTQNINVGEYKLTAVGYTHLGWATSSSAVTATYTTQYPVPNSAQTLYAVWEKKSVTVAYTTNGGILEGSDFTPNNAVLHYGEIVVLPNADQVTRDGSEFLGWKASKADAKGTTFFSSGTNYTVPDTTGIIVFTAEWVARDTTYTLHHNNVEGADYITTFTGEIGATLNASSFVTPTAMEGYTFTGWFEKTENGYVEYAKPLTFPAEDIELYAGWRMDALSTELKRCPSDIDDFVELNGETVYYYQEPSRTIAKIELSEANEFYTANDGMLYDYTKITETTIATLELKTAIDALIETPADYSLVDQYRIYYYEMTLNDPDDEYNDNHMFEHDGDVYQVTKDTFTTDSFQAFKNAVEEVVNGKGIKNQTDVDAYVEALIDAYCSLTLKEADYSEVMFAINSIPFDLSIYTDETVAKLNAAVEAVVYDLDITKQSEVDAYAEAIEEAVSKLELKEVTTNPQYEISTEKGRAGEEVEVYISIKNNPGIISLRNSISYDTTALELVGVENLGLLKGYTNPSTTISSPYILRWADSLALENNTSDGEFVKLIFKIKENTEVGDYEISVNPIESRNFNGEKIAFEAATSSITVIDYIVGDIDNDGEITDWDSIILNRYLAGWDVTIDILESADIDKDGEITDWDSIMLERYLAGWGIIIA